MEQVKVVEEKTDRVKRQQIKVSMILMAYNNLENVFIYDVQRNIPWMTLI